MPSTVASSTTCPACGSPAAGQFCAACGASLSGAACAACRAPLSPGARFCHRCGNPAGATGANVRAATASRDPLPWAVALVALCALIAMVAAQRIGAPQGSTLDAPLNAIPVPGLDFPQAAPDISSMSPRERVTRLYDRIAALHEQGKIDSARFIALNMAIPQIRAMDTLDADLRYDLGRIGEMTGVPNVAAAQADTILAEHPNHLLGLLLAARAARVSGDETRARVFDQRLLAAEAAERAKRLPEYEAHVDDIANALADARRTRR